MRIQDIFLCCVLCVSTLNLQYVSMEHLSLCDWDCCMVFQCCAATMLSFLPHGGGYTLAECVPARWPKLLLCFSYLNLDAGSPQMICNFAIKIMSKQKLFQHMVWLNLFLFSLNTNTKWLTVTAQIIGLTLKRKVTKLAVQNVEIKCVHGLTVSGL